MFICKKEVINAYTELNDPVVQRERFAQQAKVSSILNVDARCAIVVHPLIIRYGESTDQVPECSISGFQTTSLIKT